MWIVNFIDVIIQNLSQKSKSAESAKWTLPILQRHCVGVITLKTAIERESMIIMGVKEWEWGRLLSVCVCERVYSHNMI